MGDGDLSDRWIETSVDIARNPGIAGDEDEIRLGIAMPRGLLVEAGVTGVAGSASRAPHRFTELWSARLP